MKYNEGTYREMQKSITTLSRKKPGNPFIPLWEQVSSRQRNVSIDNIKMQNDFKEARNPTKYRKESWWNT